ncbi:MAG: hypothetical protein JO000_02865 [Alphaproteobacteria bacterium]|nr:hypothetical protein [Alphaproteobacteria bacterium]
MPIRAYLQDIAAFDPEAISVMSQAFESACAALGIAPTQTRERTVIATRVIDLARSGVIDAKALRERVLLEARSSGSDGAD